jgi:DNA helicase-2/ATP-dependent DNA helicase PcrA
MHPILAELDPQQQQVAMALGGPVLVLAGAGTGKTRAITHRIAYACLSGQRQAHNCLAVTYTKRAAGEMRERLVGLGVPNVVVRTFHAAALSQLRYFWPSAVEGPFPEVLSSKARLVAQAAGGLGLPTGTAMVRDLSAEVEWAGAKLVLPADYVQMARAEGRAELGSGNARIDHADVARVLAAYHELKTRANVLDFEDILLTLLAILSERPDVADAVRGAYQWFCVDEYQDITPLQERVLTAWLGDRDDICVVGDPNQTIYSFAGADPESLSRFLAKWQGATQVRLDRCYRCSPQVVAAANSLSAAVARSGTAPVAPGILGLSLRSQCPPGPVPEVFTAENDAQEAASVAQRIRALISGGARARDIAVLMRTNAASQAIESALAEAGIPYMLRGGEQFFSRPEVREALVRLRGAAAVSGHRAQADPGSPDTHSQLRRSPGQPGGAPALPEPLAARTAEVLSAMGFDLAAPAGGGVQRERWESLAAVVELAATMERAAAPQTRSELGLAQLVAELERRSELSLAPSPDGVTLASLHAAKGLEWDHVFLVGLSEGNIPISYANTPARVAEELRLLYVGVTRARIGLTLSWALTYGASGRSRTPSRFLSMLRRQRVAEVGSAGDVVRGDARSALPTRQGRRKGLARCRVCGAGLVTGAERTVGRCRGCPGSPNEELLEELKAWRRRVADDRGVPVFVVFTDVTLAAIAELAPTDSESLLAIPGVGPTKLQAYGRDLIAILTDRQLQAG